jgi:hypothetical protein
MLQKIVSNTDPTWPNIQIEYHRPIDLYVDSLYNFRDNENFKILWVKEVEEISNFRDTAIQNHKNFDLVLTYDQMILDLCDNSVMFEFGTSWVFNYDFNTVKKFQISHLTGNKQITLGHRLRQETYQRQAEILSPIDFFVSSFSPVKNTFGSKMLTESKTPLFESQFHICIENSRQKNLFTEKLIDCLSTKTVPIFFGCDNIGDFFDIRGFFIVENFSQIKEVCNSLTESSYSEKIEYIEKNFNTCKNYIYLLDRLKEILEIELNKETKNYLTR